MNKREENIEAQKGDLEMKGLIFSKDPAAIPNGAIGTQQVGIVFWQQTNDTSLCVTPDFQSLLAEINRQFSPTCIQNYTDHCFLQFDHDDRKTIYLSRKRLPDSNRDFLYGESHTVYVDSAFHLFALGVVSFIAEQTACQFCVDDATGYLEHRSLERLEESIKSFVFPVFESPDLLRRAAIDQQNRSNEKEKPDN